MMPTASAVMSDVVDISREILKDVSRCVSFPSLREDIIEDIKLIAFR